jgi:hypothetical protein
VRLQLLAVRRRARDLPAKGDFVAQTPSAKKTATKVGQAVRKPASRRKRSSAKAASETSSSAAVPEAPQGLAARHDSVRQVEQAVILALAILFALAGFAFHFLWFIAIVLMAILLGMIASTVRGRRGHGVVSEVVAEVRVMAEEIAGNEPGAPPKS